MSITCPSCGYDRNSPNAKQCEVCGDSLVTHTSVASTPDENFSAPIPLSPPSIPDIDLQPAPQYSEPPPTINIQIPAPQYLEPPPTINISTAMNITCHQCGYDRNLPNAEFCDVCGAELQSATPEVISSSEPTKLQEPLTSSPPHIEILTPEITSTPLVTTPLSHTTTAKLIAKFPNVPQTEFILEESSIVGRFDSDLGPVEVDLEGFDGVDYISRHHGEIYQERGQWKIKDLGSENGIFLKRVGQTRFSPRITAPEILNSGDEIAFAKIRFIFQTS